MLLAVDTSTKWIGLALYDGASIVGEMVWKTNNHHTVELAPAIDSLLNRCDIEISDVKAFAVALGPGSFTSLRIGLAVVKGMSLSLRVPVIGIPTLDILASAQHLNDLPMLAVLQAGRERFAVASYQVVDGTWRAQDEARVFRMENFEQDIKSPTYVCGEFSEDDREMLVRRNKNIVLASPVQSLRRPAYLAELAWKRFQRKDVDDPVSLAPIYLHVAGYIPGE